MTSFTFIPTTNDERPTTVSSKLFQESDVALKEQLQIIHAINQHGYAVHAHAEGEAGNFLRVIAIVLHELKNVRIDHAAAQNLDPARLLARAARLFFRSTATLSTSPADEAGDEHLRAGLGEGKKRRPEAGLRVRTKQCLHGMIERALQVAESYVRVHRQAFNLMEHGRMAGIRRVFAVDFARNHNAQRRLHLFHGANLHGRSVRAKQLLLAARLRFLIGEEERVLTIARGMVWRKIQC